MPASIHRGGPQIDGIICIGADGELRHAEGDFPHRHVAADASLESLESLGAPAELTEHWRSRAADPESSSDLERWDGEWPDQHAVSLDIRSWRITPPDSPDDATTVFALRSASGFNAERDPLTRSLNRDGLERQIESARQGVADGTPASLIFIDLTHFRVINETCGHQTGDGVIVDIADLLSKTPAMSPIDTARISGDQFALLVHDARLADARAIAERVLSEIQGYRLHHERGTFSLSACLGVVRINPLSGDAASHLAEADAACRLAKASGSSTIYVARPNDLAVSRLQSDVEWVACLTRALNDNQFTLYFQSLFSADNPDDTPTHHELLLRLDSGLDHPVLPGQFMRAAERFRLIPSIDRWVIRHAFEDLSRRLDSNPEIRNHRFGINLSGLTLHSQNLLSFIREQVHCYRLPPSMIYFEITETAAVVNLGAAVKTLDELKAMGFGLALDDFGSGMSSFRYLKLMPVDMVKIDGGFVRDMLTNAVDHEIVEAINSVARRMGLTTVAEYVESPEISAELTKVGVDYLQGYSCAVPTPMNRFGEPPQTNQSSAFGT